jgi:ComF family protein
MRQIKYLGKRLFEGGANLLYPSSCVVCKIDTQGEGALCADCWAEVQFIGPNCCDICGDETNAMGVCCEPEMSNLYHYDQVRYAAVYEGIIRQLIIAFKFQDNGYLQRQLSQWLYNACKKETRHCDVIIPVPMTAKALRKRKYNQAAILARKLAKFSNISYLPNILKKIKYTPPQNSLDKHNRLQNVKGAFALTNSDIIRNKRVILVDDVFTTGATVNECARVLKQEGGASSVLVSTIAKTPL